MSDGCENCYAMRQAHRFSGPGKAYERWKKTPEYQQWLKETELLMQGENHEPNAAGSDEPGVAPKPKKTKKSSENNN